MNYRRMKHRDLWEIYRRWRAGHSLAGIAAGERRERKTVRRYLHAFAEMGLERNGCGVDRQRFYDMVTPLLAGNTRRPAPATEQWLPHREELRELIGRAKDPMTPKSAYLVVKAKYGLDGSYETFKRLARAEGLRPPERPRTIRIGPPAGQETRIDYGRLGTVRDRGANRVVWAFCGVLSHSRLPYVEFVPTQDQHGFTGSFVSMWHFYGGSTEFVSMDNLKAGVLKPDVWDPQVNRALGEAAEHYGVFIGPCRPVGRSAATGRTEPFLPVAEELFRSLTALDGGGPLDEMNDRARRWCREVYGRTEHGTTGVAPTEAFAQERTALKPLPDHRFEPPVWKRVDVHEGDGFLSFGRMRFSLPAAWRGRSVWARYAAPALRLFDDRERLIRQYQVEPGKRVYWVEKDFPAQGRHVTDRGHPAWIIRQGRRYGQAAVDLLAAVLQPHAYLNARQARAMLSVMREHAGRRYFDEVCRLATQRSVLLAKTLRRMLEEAAGEPIGRTDPRVSDTIPDTVVQAHPRPSAPALNRAPIHTRTPRPLPRSAGPDRPGSNRLRPRSCVGP